MPPDSQAPKTPNYEFILRGDQKPKAKFRLALPNLPKPFGLILPAIFGLFIIVIIYAVLTGGSKSTGLGDIAARAQEISRVSLLVQNQASDPTVQSLAATTANSMNSDVAQIQSYLTKNGGKKIGSKSLAIYKKTSTDSEVQNSVQSGSIGTYYKSYLKENLSAYQSSLKKVYDSGNVKAKPMLNSSYISAQNILNSL